MIIIWAHVAYLYLILGGYFMIADWSKLTDKVNLTEESDKYKDYKFTKWMTK